MTEHAVDVALDVGASVGDYGRDLRAHGFAGRIVSFEPLSGAAERLRTTTRNDPTWEVLTMGLGATTGEALLHVSARLTSSSFLPMEKLHFDAAPDSGYISSETAHIARLDDLRQQLRLEGCSLFLKLDVQGYELEVIDGAPTTLRDVAVLEAEMSFVSLYSGQPLFAELVARLRDHGLVLGALEPVLVHPGTLELLQVNGLFRRAAPRHHADADEP